MVKFVERTAALCWEAIVSLFTCKQTLAQDGATVGNAVFRQLHFLLR
jgi:hypothetical protein